jgi:signal transduction histidine kinase
VANVLSLRSMEAGVCPIVKSPFCVHSMVSSVLAVCRMSLANRTDVSITWAGDEDASLRASVLGDEGRLAQILQNLLTSACARALLLPDTLPHTCRASH